MSSKTGFFEGTSIPRLRFALGATCALILGLALTACRKAENAASTAVRPLRTVTVPLDEGGEKVSLTGETQARYQTDIGFRVNGKTLQRPVDVGTAVKEGFGGQIAGGLHDRRRRHDRGERQGADSIVAVFPLTIMLMLIILMVQLQSFQKMFLVISMAPLGLIGVVAALLPTGTPMGFVAILGIIALSGMIIRISDPGRPDRYGHGQGFASLGCRRRCDDASLATDRSAAAAASLGMILIASEVFWGPMAYAIIRGLFVATLLTLLFLPALYVAWFRVKEPAEERRLGVTEPASAHAV